MAKAETLSRVTPPLHHGRCSEALSAAEVEVPPRSAATEQWWGWEALRLTGSFPKKCWLGSSSAPVQIKKKSKTKQTNMTFLVNWRPWRPAISANSPMGFKMELEKFMRRITRAVACGSKEWEWVPQEHFPQRHSTHGCSLEHEDVAQPQPSVCTCSRASSPRFLG